MSMTPPRAGIFLCRRGRGWWATYAGSAVPGQDRVLVIWSRIVLPNGETVALGAMPGTDTAGQAGFHDQVDSRFWLAVGTAFLTSVAARAGGDDHNGLSSAAAPVLAKRLDIQPVIAVRPGYPFNMTVTKDIVFSSPYRGE